MANSKVVLDTKGLQKLMKSTPAKVEKWLDSEAEAMVTDIKLSFGTSPSEPGNPPGVDTGTLRSTIRWERQGAFTRHIMDGVEYGIYLEDIYNRPFMAPAFAREQKIIGQSARDNLGLEDV